MSLLIDTIICFFSVIGFIFVIYKAFTLNEDYRAEQIEKHLVSIRSNIESIYSVINSHRMCIDKCDKQIDSLNKNMDSLLCSVYKSISDLPKQSKKK
jgi:peptidoglycan hydrolase CwlO-like protein